MVRSSSLPWSDSLLSDNISTSTLKDEILKLLPWIEVSFQFIVYHKIMISDHQFISVVKFGLCFDVKLSVNSFHGNILKLWYPFLIHREKLYSHSWKSVWCERKASKQSLSVPWNVSLVILYACKLHAYYHTVQRNKIDDNRVDCFVIKAGYLISCGIVQQSTRNEHTCIVDIHL